jgi:hypothetical protein
MLPCVQDQAQKYFAERLLIFMFGSWYDVAALLKLKIINPCITERMKTA